MHVNDTPRTHIRVFDIKPDGWFGEGSLFYTLQGDEPGHADGCATHKFRLVGRCLL
jgi:hypothetical protein